MRMRVVIFHMEGRGCMNYKLHERIALRSRKLVLYAYYIYGVELAQGLTAEQFGLLSRCDGEHDLPGRHIST